VAHDPLLADRIRALLAGEDGVTEQRAFGGLAFLVHGNMAVSADNRGGVMVRVDPAWSAELTAEPHVAPMEMRGRTMAGWLHVDPDGAATDEQLQRWVDTGLAFARTLPPK
jgi:hypothetical protein